MRIKKNIFRAIKIIIRNSNKSEFKYFDDVERIFGNEFDHVEIFQLKRELGGNYHDL